MLKCIVFFRVADSKECKMPIENLAKVFGPTIVGYSSDDPDSRAMYSETPQQAKVRCLCVILLLLVFSKLLS